MKLEPGKRYALVENNRIVYIFDESLCKEVEDSLNPIEIPSDEHIVVGCRYENGQAKPMSLEEAKDAQAYYINNRFDSEVSELQGEYVPKEEVLTYSLQLSEAKDYKEHNDASRVPFISALATSRGQDLDFLADKIIEKNTSYTTRLATIMGYRQSLKARLEKAQSFKEVMDIEYKSPYGFE